MRCNFVTSNKPMKQFITSDENVLNKYGFRVLTAGIDTSQFDRNPLMYYMHNRAQWNPKGNEVIGKWENVQKKKGQLMAQPIIDTEEKFAKTIAGKVERGFIRMASIGIQVVETSSDPKYLLAGQTRPTVTKCILREISIVDEGANDNALMLYSEDGNAINLSTGGDIPQLAELSTHKTKTDNMSQFKTLAVALSLKAEATETEVLTAITALKTAKETAETNLSAHQKKVQDANKLEAKQLLKTAVEALKLVDDAKTNFENTYKALFAADHANAKAAILASMPVAAAQPAATAQLGSFMKTLEGAEDGQTDAKLSFDYLQKYDPAKLEQLKAAQPETYQKLVNDYAAGVRYNKPTN